MRWIPTTERYPNKAGQYLVTVISSRGEKAVGILNFKLEGRDRRPTFFNPYIMEPVKVTAWMKIPFPYDERDQRQPAGMRTRDD